MKMDQKVAGLASIKIFISYLLDINREVIWTRWDGLSCCEQMNRDDQKTEQHFFSKSSIQCLNSLLVHVQRLQAIEGEWKASPDFQKMYIFCLGPKEWQPNWLFRGTRLDRSNKKCNDCLFSEKCHWLKSHVIERSNESDRSHSQFCHVFA